LYLSKFPFPLQMLSKQLSSSSGFFTKRKAATGDDGGDPSASENNRIKRAVIMAEGAKIAPADLDGGAPRPV
jgi:hypothetical protein